MNANTKITAPVLTLLRGVRLEGDLSVVTPGPVDHLHERDLAILNEAERLHTSGEVDRAAKMILRLEQRLGITQADRLAAAAPVEDWEDDLVAALLDLSAEPEPEPVQAYPRTLGRLNEPEEKAVLAAAAKLARAKTKGNKAIATGELARIDSRRNQRVELRERAEGIAETVKLAKARGEEVSDNPIAGGGARMLSRDGLRQLRERGHLTDAHYAVGLQYREGYEARSCDLQAASIGETGGGAHDNDKFVEARLKRAKALDFVARVDRAVAIGAPISALQMLRWVAGDAGALRAWGGGRAFDRNRSALVDALNVALGVKTKLAEESRRREVSENPGKTSQQL